MAEHETDSSQTERKLEESLEVETDPPFRSIAITVGAICFLILASFVWYASRLGTTPERECSYRGGAWISGECIFEGGAGKATEQVGMKEKKITIVVPETKNATVVFANIEIGALFKETQTYDSGGAQKGTVSLISELGRVGKETQDLVMPFAVNSGGSGTFIYLGVFQNIDEGYTLRDSVLVGNRIGTQGLALSSVDTNKVYSARLSYRDRRDDEPLSAIPTEPRTLEAVILNHLIDRSFVSGRDGLLYKDVLKVAAPTLRDSVVSPLTVSGQARGQWFSKGSFHVSLVDWDGRIIGEGSATAKGEWMTDEFVPFSVTFTFTLPPETPYKRGALILQKNNPSGLPENDDAFEIPVLFGE